MLDEWQERLFNEIEGQLQSGQVTVFLDNGEMFEGTVNHWRDCFFDNPTLIQIIDFARKENVTVSFRFPPV